MRRTAVVIAAALALAAAACTARQQPRPPVVTPLDTTPSASATSTAAVLPPLPPASEFATAVTNPYFPLTTGSKWVYAGVRDGKPTTDTMTVTDGAKTILGIRAVVVRDTLKSEGRLIEDTEDWYAQDRAGNVWYLGEATAEYDEQGSVDTTAGSWEAGVDGAQAGIFMPAAPSVGQSFKQEYYKGQAEDEFTIVSMTATVNVPYGSYDDALATQERTPLEPDVLGEKYYVMGIGLVFDNDLSGATEYAKLVEFTK